MGTYWVSSNGAATWANAENPTPISGASCASVALMNANIAAGDTVYLRAGTYNFSATYGAHMGISGKDGAASNWITIANYNSEDVQFVGTYGDRMWGLEISDSSYIKISGIVFNNYSDYEIYHLSNHLEIGSCTFRNVTSPYRGGIFYLVEAAIGGGSVDKPVNHIWIHDCVMNKLSGGGSACDDEGSDALRIGYPGNTVIGGTTASGQNMNITVENCKMAYAGHAVFDNYGQKCVVKNNWSHNEPWYPEYGAVSCTAPNPADYVNNAYDGLYSHRNFHITDTFASDKRYNLYERNRLGHAGVNPMNDGSTNLTIGSPGNIIRYNYLFNAMHNNMKTKWGDGYGWQASGGCRNRIYNNTLYKSGYGYQPFIDDYPWPMALRGFRYYAVSDNPGNVFKNNIVYNSYAGDQGADDIEDCTSIPDSVEENNWGTNTGHGCVGSGDPKFTDSDLTDPTSATLPDLRLKSISPCINQGTYLTLANGAGTATITLIVDDALYFQDGSWGASMTHGVTLFPDQIAIGTVDNIATISSINYGTDTITLSTAKTWSDNDSVWLYKNSDGERVLYGAAPDIGADEYNGTDSGLIVWFRSS